MEGHGGAKRRSAEGVGSEEGRRSPSLVWGSGAIAPPEKKLKFNSANLSLLAVLATPTYGEGERKVCVYFFVFKYFNICVRPIVCSESDHLNKKNNELF